MTMRRPACARAPASRPRVGLIRMRILTATSFAAAVGCQAPATPSPSPGPSPTEAAIVWTNEPRTLFLTDPFETGTSYTFGSTSVPDEVTRPVTVTAVELIRSTGIEGIGVGAFDPDGEGTAIGLAPGWPPEEPAVGVTDVPRRMSGGPGASRP